MVSKLIIIKKKLNYSTMIGLTVEIRIKIALVIRIQADTNRREFQIAVS